MKKHARKARAPKAPGFHYHPNPSKYTLFRHQIYDSLAREVVLEMHLRLKERLWMRDRTVVQRVAAAGSLEELLDLTPLAVGLGLDAWEARLKDFDSGLVRSAILERLKSARLKIKDEVNLSTLYERCIGALRWQGKAGGQALLECFDALDAHGKALACVVFGLVKESGAAEQIWDFYQENLDTSRGNHSLGAMWGLVDLRDARAVPALVDQMQSGQWNYELFGWLSMRGDVSTIAPLMQAIVRSPEKVRIQPMMALLSVVHRVGKADFIAEIQRAYGDEAPGEELQSMTSNLFSQPASLAENHFETFYKGLSPDSVRRVLNEL